MNLSKIYSLPEILKKYNPRKPVVYTIGSIRYFLSKQLFELLNKSIKKTKSYIRNGFDSREKIKLYYS